MSKRTLLIGLAVVSVALGVVVWRGRHRTVAATILSSDALTTLSAEDVVLMLEDQALSEPSKVYSIVETSQTRKIFLSGLRDYLALAARARREGLADQPHIRLTLEYKANYLLRSLYQNKLDRERKEPFEISNEQIDSVWKNSENEQQFQKEVLALQAVQESVAAKSGNPHAAPPLQGEALEKTRKDWAKTKILSDMAKADTAFINQRAIRLRIQVAEAGVLAFNYVRDHWVENVIPTNTEINAYLAAHPEYDVNKKRVKAEMVLRRAKAGEDFAKLAKEFSEDRSARDNGGLYENLTSGILWPEVETVALSLTKGQIADKLVETAHGFHVVQLVDTKTEKDESGSVVTKFSVRHILLRRTFEEPGVSLNSDTPPPYREPRDIATMVVQNEKRRRFIDKISGAEEISLPEDFPFEITAELRTAALSKTAQVQDLIKKDEASRNPNQGRSAEKK